LELEAPGRRYSTFAPDTLGRGLRFLHCFDGFVITAAMAAAIKASKSVSTFAMCALS
jgi:hypothetical protein